MRSSIRKIAVTGVFIALPLAGVGVPASAALGTSSTPAVLPAPPPADPPTVAPPPPAPAPPIGREYNATEDWWVYSGAETGGGGGGGG